eukprot:scpid100294/ scgid22761/ 
MPSTRSQGTTAPVAHPEPARTARRRPAATSATSPAPPTPSSAGEEMPSWFASAFTNLSSQIKGVQEEATAARAEVAKLKAAQSLTSQITQAPKPKLKSPGLQAQFATNETVLQKVDAAISVLPDSAPEAKELLTQGKHEICKRQKHLKIADSFDWETVRVYEEGSVGDSLADDKRIADAASTARRLKQLQPRERFQPETERPYPSRNFRAPSFGNNSQFERRPSGHGPFVIGVLML